MKLEQIYAGENYKILNAEVPGGGTMPEHYATSDAFVIIRKGEASVNFDDGTQATIKEGATYLIPGNKRHNLQVLKDFEAFIVIGPEAKIEMAK